MTVLPDGWENKPRAFSYDVMRAKINARGWFWMCAVGSVEISTLVIFQLVTYLDSAIPWWVIIPPCSVIFWSAGFIVIRLTLRNCTRDILARQCAADLAKQQHARNLQ